MDAIVDEGVFFLLSSCPKQNKQIKQQTEQNKPKQQKARKKTNSAAGPSPSFVHPPSQP